MPTVQELKKKYGDRIDPSDKDKEKGVIPLTNIQKAAIEQGIDPETGLHWTAGNTVRDGVSQGEELQYGEDDKTVKVKGKGKNAGEEVEKNAAVVEKREANENSFGAETAKVESPTEQRKAKKGK